MDLQSRFAPVAQRIARDARLVDVRDLGGGMSAQITVLELHTPADRQTVVVRQYGPKNTAVDPHPATTETTLLRLLRDYGMPVPAPWLADDDSELLGGPYSVIDYVDATGAPLVWSAAVADQLVDVLDRLHRLPVAEADRVLPPYARRIERWLDRTPDRPDEPMREQAIRAVLADWWRGRRELPPSILHGDFWPGNTMWRGDRLVAVIDWEDAAVGDPRSDLANLRLELTWAYGPEAAEDFTRRYADRRETGSDHQGDDQQDDQQPYWDLVAATRPVGRLAEWGLDPQRLDLYLARFQGFVDAALDRIAGRSANL